MARDPDTIQREIEQAQQALADTVNVLAERANPKKLVDGGKASIQDKLAEPKVKYTLIGVGAIVAVLLVRKLLR
ncbi:DUF3618 domain-containing protein [Pseudonocardia spinosispora]|uniref:DUF3618 domain-containing protein n=1 Tax=Pseudonocardia spinosispora TaxID=103441 RepID=UPI0003FF0B12|nr:DUF3618 domain-containing protein [Pseudonocardia spinosispora]